MRLLMLVLTVLAGFAAPVRAANTLITILTGGTSGVYYPLGIALSGIYGKAIPGATVTVQSTDGSVQNLKLLEAGDGELAFTLGDTLAAAWAGENASFATPLTKLRAIARIYTNYIQIVASTRSGISTLSDLKGKRVSVGAKGSGTALNAEAIFKAAGFTFADLGKVEYTQFGVAVRKVERGDLDATFQSAGLGVESIRHLLASGRAKLIPIPPEVVARIGSRAYEPGTIPAGTYPGQTAEIPTAVIPNFLVTREGVADDTAYAMTKGLFDGLEELVKTQPAAKGITLTKALSGLPIPLHPGAKRYYRAIGTLK